MSKLSSILSSVFFFLLIIQMVPSLFKNLKNSYDDTFSLKAKVGFLKIKDSINEASSYCKTLKKFFEREDIKAILLNIESGGGAAGSSQAIYNEINLLKKEHPKPIIVLINDMCASGAYYIASACDYIIASPMAMIGNIGSYVGYFKFRELLESWKIKYNIKQSGKYKTVLNPFSETPPELNEMVQSLSDDVYKQFVNDVAVHRKLSINNADKWANGKVFTGKQALDVHLIDELGSESNAIKKIRELAMIEKEKKIEWIKPTKPSKYSNLFGIDEDDDDRSYTSLLMEELVEKIYSKLNSKPNSKVMLN